MKNSKLPSTHPINPPKNPFKPLVAGCVSLTTLPSVGVAVCHRDSHKAGAVHNCKPINTTQAHTAARCVGVLSLPFYHLTHCQSAHTVKPIRLAYCKEFGQTFTLHLSAHTFMPTTQVVQYGGCVAVFDGTKRHFYTCQTNTTAPTLSHTNCLTLPQAGKLALQCQRLFNEQAVPVPCRFYPIAEIPPPPLVRACKPRPTSDKLPLALVKKAHNRQELSAHVLPLPLACWHHTPKPTTPNKESYIVHHTISAHIAGIGIDPLAFSIKTDMDSFCWQGSVELSPQDYERIKPKLDVPRGQEPLITVVVNGQSFVLIAEDLSKTRSFVNHTYTLSGRSMTAHLSKDYANVVKLDNDLYASQIVGEALKDLPINADFEVADWRLHAVLSGTPIALIDEIARACGGFVASDKAQGRLYIRPRYKVPAWELATTTPDRIIALDVIKSISEQKRTNPRYNAVILTNSHEGAVVYREREGQDRHAPVSQNPLYTDQACIIPKGIQILSDSGTHQSATLTLLWADKYNLPLAVLGQIWQVNDQMGANHDAWRGIVVSVAVEVKMDDGVPVVWQTIGLDRYLDS